LRRSRLRNALHDARAVRGAPEVRFREICEADRVDGREGRLTRVGQNFSTHGRSSLSHVHELRSCFVTLRYFSAIVSGSRIESGAPEAATSRGPRIPPSITKCAT